MDLRRHAPARLHPGPHCMVFYHLVGQTIEQHPHPAWKIIIPVAGHVTWASGNGPSNSTAAVVFPPQITHVTTTTAESAEVFIDPWFLGLGPGHGRAIPLDQSAVEHVRTLWHPDIDGDPDERVRETAALLRRWELLPQAISIDPRVEAALRDLPIASRIQHVATAVGLSSSRLRGLIHVQTGTPPAQLRLWQRLRIAIVSLLVQPIVAAAVDAGFADQAHLTRTATRLVGYTPRDLACALSSAPDPRDGDRLPATASAA